MAIEDRMLLALPTIEDRAKYIFANIEKKGVYDCWGNHAWQFSEYGAFYAIEGAMKIQDRIARKEERERCIKNLVSMHVLLCPDGATANELRKRLEGGEQ